MGWLVLALLAGAVFVALWRSGRFAVAQLQLLAAGLLVAAAGYAWQGEPGLPGTSVAPPPKLQAPAGGEATGLGPGADTSAWLAEADRYGRAGDTRGATETLRTALRTRPGDADLWVGLGNALVIHSDGRMSPAAQLAFERAAALAPEHPGPKYFAGLALAQNGKLDEAEQVWRTMIENAPADADWKAMVQERLDMLAVTRRASALPQP